MRTRSSKRCSNDPQQQRIPSFFPQKKKKKISSSSCDDKSKMPSSEIPREVQAEAVGSEPAIANTPPTKICCNGSVPCSPKKRQSPHNNKPPPPPLPWNPTDPVQMKAVKEALHVSNAPKTVVCRENEQNEIFDFCKSCIATGEAGSLYVCGCPGTGKTLSIDRVKDLLQSWTKQVGFQSPEILAVNCTTLPRTADIFSKIRERHHLLKFSDTGFALQHLQDLYSKRKQPSSGMMLVVVDEMDYLITKDKAVLHDLFMLTTLPFSRLILIGIANAIDLADRFLPRLELLNCKPKVVTFRAYSIDQILRILQQRLVVLGYEVFQPEALEFCAKKVGAASGDMRRALAACMSSIEVLEIELKDPNTRQEANVVSLDHMYTVLSKAFRSPIVETIQSLPQHQQMILCSLVKLLKTKKSSTTIGELNRSYLGICRSTQVPPSGILEFSNMCQVLSDHGLLKLGQSRHDKMKSIALLTDSADVTFALKDVRFFRTCLE